jgi:hypothetical protein
MSEDRKMYMDPEDKLVRLELWWDDAINQSRTKEAGYPVYDKALKLAVRSPGAPKQVFACTVEKTDIDGNVDRSELYYNRYKHIIEMFKSGATGPAVQGLPLLQWAVMDKATAKTYTAAGVHTVEQLAALEGTQLQGLGMGAQSWKKKAQAHLAQMSSGAEVSKLAGENADLKKRLEQMEATIAQIAAAKPAKASKSAVAAE